MGKIVLFCYKSPRSPKPKYITFDRDVSTPISRDTFYNEQLRKMNQILIGVAVTIMIILHVKFPTVSPLNCLSCNMTIWSKVIEAGDSAYLNYEINSLVTNGLSHSYHLDESTFIFRGIRSKFSSDENHLSKQNSPRWDAAFCGVTSGAILFAYVP